MVNIEINGEPLKAELGQMIIEVADRAGVVIPRFCYHKKLKIAANCRMCLVELDGGRKPMPACATPITDGMKVFTKSPKALEYQKTVMEFLLANHPLDCPVCDQGGECELQDNSMAYGKDVSRFNLDKRSVPDKDIGPLISTEFTRCIHCTRCVRFGVDIAGEPELGMTGRGEHSEIATFIESAVNNELSGNVIDLCPVGALTNKDARFKARPWELTQHAAIAGHDCVGSNIYLHERRGTPIRVVPRENEEINEVWISDRDRYSLAALRSEERLTHPMIKNKKSGEWEKVEWTQAFEFLISELNKVLKTHKNLVAGAELNSSSNLNSDLNLNSSSDSALDPDTQVGLLLSPSSTIEEAYLAQKWMRSFGCENVDYRLRHESFDFGYESIPGINCKIEEIAKADAIFCFGGNFRKDHPIIHQRIRYASRFGAKIAVLNPADFDFRLKRQHILQLTEISELPIRLAGILKILIEKLDAKEKIKPGLFALLSTLDSQANSETNSKIDLQEDSNLKADLEITEILMQAKSPMILSGLIAEQHPEGALIAALQSAIMELLNAKGGFLTQGANSAGCYLAGAWPNASASRNPGKNAAQMLKEGLKAYFLLGVEPEWDSAYGAVAVENFKKADLVVCFNAFASQSMKQYANILLPINTYFETSGTFVNASGEWQSFAAACRAPEESKPLWKVLRVLANLMELKDFEYESTEQIREALKTKLSQEALGSLGAGGALGTQSMPFKWPKKFSKLAGLKPFEMICCSLTPIYQIDGLVRRSMPLQSTQDGIQAAFARISDEMASEMGVVSGDSVMVTQQIEGIKRVCRFFVKVGGVASRTIMLPMGLEESAGIFHAFGHVLVQKG
jgi:NADH-quinone oxidoreductase subunit G